MTPTCDDPAELAPVAMDSNLWRSTCGCGQVTCESGSYDDAMAALDTHRPQSPTPEEGGQ